MEWSTRGQALPVRGAEITAAVPRRWTWLRLGLVCALAAVLLGGGAHLLVRAAGTAIDEPALNESSGLAASQQNPGILWSHNDSGRDAELYAFTADGREVATLVLPGVEIRDWEDMAIGPATDGEPFAALYVGDIGDNKGGREHTSVYRLSEPDLGDVVAGQPVTLTAQSVERFDLVYDDGPRDAETLMVDPRDGTVYVVAKTTDETAGLYLADLSGGASSDETPITLVHQSDVAIPGLIGITRLVTGGAISPSADRVVLRTYVGAWWWSVASGQSIADALTPIPKRISLPLMRQGEAVAFSADGRTLYVTSEGSPALLGAVPAPGGGGTQEPLTQDKRPFAGDFEGGPDRRPSPSG